MKKRMSRTPMIKSGDWSDWNCAKFLWSLNLRSIKGRLIRDGLTLHRRSGIAHIDNMRLSRHEWLSRMCFASIIMGSQNLFHRGDLKYEYTIIDQMLLCETSYFRPNNNINSGPGPPKQLLASCPFISRQR